MNQCEFSPCRKYRYTLWREWPVEDLLVGECSAETQAHRYVQFIGLNPSTADETKNDPTVRRCISFARRWGYGAMVMTNIFAWRDTDPEKMKLVDEPIGPENDDWLIETAAKSGLVVAAWGNHGDHRNRQDDVKRLLSHIKLKCFLITGKGCPIHPLYQPDARQLIDYQ
jgi:hypothetical protein